MRLEDRVVIVTGAARGIGRVYAKAAAAEGAKVVVSDVLDGEEAVEEIRKGGGEAMYVRADCVRRAERERPRPVGPRPIRPRRWFGEQRRARG
ncbi:MAG: SDR family NAD(P)-dependent oxidoreductase, partial [Nitrospinota bacterium]|nr:SDR family NAD(P)-dependent oxidoreductase [Nitrospinota bacterium]